MSGPRYLSQREAIDPVKTVSTLVMVTPPSHEFGAWVSRAIPDTSHNIEVSVMADGRYLSQRDLVVRALAPTAAHQKLAASLSANSPPRSGFRQCFVRIGGAEQCRLLGVKRKTCAPSETYRF